MTVAGIFSTLLNYGTQSTQSAQSATPGQQSFQQEFQRLGQDLQSGNLSAAQTDFAALQQTGNLPVSTASTGTSSSIAQEFSQLSADLKAGKLSSAKQDYESLRQDFENHKLEDNGRHHRHSTGGSGSNPISQLMGQLGQALQTGNLTSAQQAYSALEQDFQRFTQSSASTNQPASNSVSISA